MSIKHKGADSILYNSVKGTIINTAIALSDDTWHKISAVGAATALPTVSSGASQVGAIFKTPKNAGSAITLVAGDAVWPLTLTEVCKVDVESSGEMGVIDTTDSCDYPYNVSIPDGFTALSGSINTMMRFDEETDALVSVTTEFLKKFYDIVEDDGDGTYSLTSKDDSDLLLMILATKDALDVTGKIENWWIVPAILNSISNNFALKDVDKADYGWTKGQGPASVYLREVIAAVP